MFQTPGPELGFTEQITTPVYSFPRSKWGLDGECWKAGGIHIEKVNLNKSVWHVKGWTIGLTDVAMASRWD